MREFRDTLDILDVIKRNPLFLHEIEWKNNGFFFTIPKIYIRTHAHIRGCLKIQLTHS